MEEYEYSLQTPLLAAGETLLWRGKPNAYRPAENPGYQTDYHL